MSVRSMSFLDCKHIMLFLTQTDRDDSRSVIETKIGEENLISLNFKNV